MMVCYTGGMPKKMHYPENVSGACPEGTSERLQKILKPGETRSAFVREAVLKAIATREGLQAIPTFNARDAWGNGCDEWIGDNPNACDDCSENYWRHPESQKKDWGE